MKLTLTTLGGICANATLDYYSKISENFYYKVMYIYNLKEFASEIIEDDYVLQEKGKLISVFKRVSNP